MTNGPSPPVGEESPCLEQWRRVQRRHDRFQQIDSGVEHTIESDHYKDAVVSFFTDCFHLNDWFKNDASVSSLRRTLSQSFTPR
jgi:hypothetical protein